MVSEERWPEFTGCFCISIEQGVGYEFDVLVSQGLVAGIMIFHYTYKEQL